MESRLSCRPSLRLWYWRRRGFVLCRGFLLLLVGAAPNAIAYASKQFTTREFFTCGIPASILLMIVLGIFVWLIWPAMGMPVLLAEGVPTP